ncbi:MAG: cytochrome P450 [Alphaproteobacteria bacterium]|nr:cytochrome P450 [Alphaproteobacteria bacterium]
MAPCVRLGVKRTRAGDAARSGGRGRSNETARMNRPETETETDAGAGAASAPLRVRLRDPEQIEAPWGLYSGLHARDGVGLDEETGVWIVAGYNQIHEILRDQDRFSAEVDRPSLRPEGMPEAAKAILAETVQATPTLVGADPPTHTRLRPLVNMVFSAERVDAMAPGVTEIVDSLIESFIDEGACEFVSAFSAPLPLTIIADQLGLGRERIGLVKTWSDAFIQILGLMGDDSALVESARLQRDAIAFLLGEAAARRAAPADTLLSALANVRDEDGRHLRDSELISILVQLMVAGNETTTNTLTAGMLILAQDQALQDRVRGGDARTMRIFVEEVLRAESPVQGHYRRAKCPVHVGGHVIPAGAVVHLRYGAGNRDERVFPDAARIDVARANAPQHLAFGGGPHFCVGAMLARRELAIGFRRLLDRLDAIVLNAAPENLRRVQSVQHRGVVALPIRFSRRTE